MFKKPENGKRRMQRDAGDARANANACPALVTPHHSLYWQLHGTGEGRRPSEPSTYSTGPKRPVLNYPASRIHAINHARKGDDLSNVLRSADPRHRAFEPQSKSCVRHAAIAPQIEVPLKGLFRQMVLA